MTPSKRIIDPNSFYHVMNKSIAKYKIFNSDSEYCRIIQALRYYSTDAQLPKLSYFLKRSKELGKNFEELYQETFQDTQKNIQIAAYCLMPTHVHFLIKELREGSMANALSNTLNSYTRFFNTKRKRKGPLWVGRYKSVRVNSDEQLQHLTRYIHLNPVTARLVDKPWDWSFSSYKEYVSPQQVKYPLCQFEGLFDFKPTDYREFVDDQIDYQRELASIKKLVLE